MSSRNKTEEFSCTQLSFFAIPYPNYVLTNLIPKNIKHEDFGLYYGHHKTMNRFVSQKKGLSISPLPFPGAVYIIGTGENQSQVGTERTGKPNRYNRDGKVLRYVKKLYKLFNSKPLSKSIYDEFTLYKI